MKLLIAAISILVCCCPAAASPVTAPGTTSISDKGHDRLMSVRITYAIYSFDREAASRQEDQSGSSGEMRRTDIPNLIIIFLRDTTPADLVRHKLQQLNIIGNIDQFTREIDTFQNSMKDPSLQLSSGTQTAGVNYKTGSPVFVAVVVTKFSLTPDFEKDSIRFSIDEARKFFADAKIQ